MRSGKIEKPDLVWLYSPWLANLVTEATGDERILYVTRRLNKANPQAEAGAVRIAARMQHWLQDGVRMVLP
jgi:hypothetical protein